MKIISAMLLFWIYLTFVLNNICAHDLSEDNTEDDERKGNDLNWEDESLSIDVSAYKRSLEADLSKTRRKQQNQFESDEILEPKNINPRKTRRFLLAKGTRRIFNADETAKIVDHPYMAAILLHDELWCGGVVIGKDKVLTAAHCLQLQYNNRFFREYVRMLSVRLGSENVTYGGQIMRVGEIFFHPNYEPQTLQFNFAVLVLQKNLTFNDERINSIDYSRKIHLPADADVTFLGWGATSEDEDRGEVLLQKVVLPMYNLRDCQDIYGRDLVTTNNFCAGFIALMKNVCNHDAGGPAILNGEVVGILSFSHSRCDVPDKPAVFSAVGRVSQWLDNIQERKLTGYNIAG